MMRRLRFPLFIALMLAALCLPAAAAQQATIYRDVWGVPHVYAATETAAAYAYGYAQAQDRLIQIFRNYKQAEGSLAEVDGPSAVEGDFIARVVGHAAVSKQKYYQTSSRYRLTLEAFQAGIKQYMKEHPEEVPAWAPKLEPWMATAVLRSIIFNWPLGEMMDKLGGAGISLPSLSSNEWAISPSRTADKCAMLYIDPHIPWSGMFRFHEARIHGGSLSVSGFVPVGTPFVGLGHNEYVGWACTTGGPETSDVFVETVNPDNPMQYKVDGGWRDFDTMTIKLQVKQGDKLAPLSKQLLVSRHGPVIAVKDGKAYALATPYIDQAGQLEMIGRLNHAKSTEEVKQICASNQWMAQNFMYAGTDGHIRYIRVGRVPIRPEVVDPLKPIPGDTTANDWLGIHPQDDLVQIEDPADGFMQNCNITPTIMSKTQPVDPAKYRPYIFNATTSRPWAARGTRAVNLLAADDNVTLQDALAIVNDTYRLGWENVQPVLAAAAKAMAGEIAAIKEVNAQQVVDTLVSWDGRMETDSVGATLFMAWWGALPQAAPGIDRDALLHGDLKPTPEQGAKLLAALRPAVEQLLATHQTWQVPWGQVNRVGRDGRTFPLAGAGEPETLRAVGGNYDAKTGTILNDGGQSCTTLVLFKPGRVTSYSVTPWGESDHPQSKHYLDQAEKLFSKKLLKPTWFQKEDLLRGKNIESTTVLEVP